MRDASLLFVFALAKEGPRRKRKSDLDEGLGRTSM